MITWMQKNKKYLVITIWISVISFIAASMIGWGEYSFSLSNKVASVGKINITIDDLNNEYGILYEEYNKEYQKNTGKPFDREQAELFKLDEQALERLINKALVINFAMDYGLMVSDEEIAKAIQNTVSFQENNIYSNALYKEVLQRNRIKPNDYENRVRESLLLEKAIKIFKSRLTPIEKEILSLPSKIKDNLEIKIIDSSKINVNINNKELLNYYEKNKDLYTEKLFEVEEIVVNINDIQANMEDIKQYYEDNKSSYVKDGTIKKFNEVKDSVENDFKKKEAHKIAFKVFNEFKSGNKKTISNESEYDDVINKLESAKNSDIIEPIFLKNKFIVLKLLDSKKNVKPYNEVKDDVYTQYKEIMRKDAIDNYAKSQINIFKGIKIGYFGINDIKNINGLNIIEKNQLLQKIFTNNDINGYMIMGDKVILYRILDQKIDDDNNITNNNQELELLANIKNNILDKTIIEFLKNKYKIVNNFNKGLAWNK